MSEFSPSTPSPEQPEKVELRFERAWINEQFRRQFWPIELCIAWALMRSEVGAAEAWLSHRFSSNVPVEGWAAAAAALVENLRSDALAAEGADAHGERRALTAAEWRNLELVRIGAHYRACSAAKVHQFLDIQLRRSDVQKRFPASAAVTQRVSGSIAKERACKVELIKLMTANPNAPISKNQLKKRREFEGLSKRAFERVFVAAALEAQTPAWSKAGRRSQKLSQG